MFHIVIYNEWHTPLCKAILVPEITPCFPVSKFIGFRRSLGGSLEGPLPDIITGTAPENSTHVYFKDMIVAASDDSEEESEPSERGSLNYSGGEGTK